VRLPAVYDVRGKREDAVMQGRMQAPQLATNDCIWAAKSACTFFIQPYSCSSQTRPPGAGIYCSEEQNEKVGMYCLRPDLRREAGLA